LGDIFLYHNVGDDILEFKLPAFAYRNLALLVAEYSHILNSSKHRGNRKLPLLNNLGTKPCLMIQGLEMAVCTCQSLGLKLPQLSFPIDSNSFFPIISNHLLCFYCGHFYFQISA